MRSITEIIKVLKEHEPEIKKRFHVKQIGVFGSYVRRENRKESDVDVLVEFEKGADVSLIDFIKLEYYLSDLLGVKVDLVEKSSLKPGIGSHILREVVYV